MDAKFDPATTQKLPNGTPQVIVDDLWMVERAGVFLNTANYDQGQLAQTEGRNGLAQRAQGPMSAVPVPISESCQSPPAHFRSFHGGCPQRCERPVYSKPVLHGQAQERWQGAQLQPFTDIFGASKSGQFLGLLGFCHRAGTGLGRFTKTWLPTGRFLVEPPIPQRQARRGLRWRLPAGSTALPYPETGAPARCQGRCPCRPRC